MVGGAQHGFHNPTPPIGASQPHWARQRPASACRHYEWVIISESESSTSPDSGQRHHQAHRGFGAGGRDAGRVGSRWAPTRVTIKGVGARLA